MEGEERNSSDGGGGGGGGEWVGRGEEHSGRSWWGMMWSYLMREGWRSMAARDEDGNEDEDGLC
ncbi:hypothetical protein E2C01_008635 [Portunus trituberculatus]|uniref:Uncharacterized protein n=1 Tax=Portunus trituberculatus TaxID=210409 RepID=A0A5B7D5K0_PORTR|nr:hypothetical protein [Portunus trituberculatus]